MERRTLSRRSRWLLDPGSQHHGAGVGIHNRRLAGDLDAQMIQCVVIERLVVRTTSTKLSFRSRRMKVA